MIGAELKEAHPVPEKNPDGSPLTPQQVVDFVKNNPISLEDLSLTPNYNLFDDFIDFTVKEEAVNNASNELKVLIAKGKDIEAKKNEMIAEAKRMGRDDLIPTLMASDKGFKQVVERKTKALTVARKEQMETVQKIMIFQSAMSLYSTIKGEGIARSSQGFVVDPPIVQDIEKSVDRLGIAPEKKAALKEFFSQTIGKNNTDRASFFRCLGYL